MSNESSNEVDTESVPMNRSLEKYGFVPFFVQQTSLDEVEQGRVGRVTEVQRALIKVSDGSTERCIPMTPTWSRLIPKERPTIGDWVVLNDRHSRLERVLDRKSLFRRVAAGDKAEIQLIAANIDILFVVTSCNEEFKESRIERYLALALEAGVIPVIVLTKTDLSDNPYSFVERARSIQTGVFVESINAQDRSSFNGVLGWIEPGSTIALVGSSGVGKSTILNTLADTDIAATGEIREDDKKGRHTTSHRALYSLSCGGLIIDVPGIRELSVAEVDDGLATVFSDIESEALKCRFADCRHESEPGCAVRKAINNGNISARRLQNYQKLIRENNRNSASVAERRSQGRTFAKLVRQVKTLKQNQVRDK